MLGIYNSRGCLKRNMLMTKEGIYTNRNLHKEEFRIPPLNSNQVSALFKYSLFCSISFISSGGIFNLSICSLTTLAHFCKESKAVHGLDMSTTSITRVSFSELVSIANLRRPLWYRSPSKIQTLHLVWSVRKKRPKKTYLVHYRFLKISLLSLLAHDILLMWYRTQVLESNTSKRRCLINSSLEWYYQFSQWIEILIKNRLDFTLNARSHLCWFQQKKI